MKKFWRIGSIAGLRHHPVHPKERIVTDFQGRFNKHFTRNFCSLFVLFGFLRAKVEQKMLIKSALGVKITNILRNNYVMFWCVSVTTAYNKQTSLGRHVPVCISQNWAPYSLLNWFYSSKSKNPLRIFACYENENKQKNRANNPEIELCAWEWVSE